MHCQIALPRYVGCITNYKSYVGAACNVGVGEGPKICWGTFLFLFTSLTYFFKFSALSLEIVNVFLNYVRCYNFFS